MTTTDAMGTYPPLPPSAAPRRLLRRSRSNRVAAGVSSGLGEYFGLDPVLFRVLFATSAFFGGAGILAYLLAWAGIPEEGTEHAPIDGWIQALRRRRVPVWLVAIVGGLILWAAAFSWWAPGPFFPVIAVIVLLVVFYGRRDMQASARPAPPTAADAAPAVDLTKTEAETETMPTADAPLPPDQPNWVRDARSWFDESRAASRARRRRALPVRIAILGTLVAALTVLGIVDAATGIQLQTYFWTALGILVGGLLIGLVLRRFPVSLTSLLVPSVLGVVAFGGSHASLHDGFGQRDWRPTSAAAADYRLAFGQGVLDLRNLPGQSIPSRIDITVGAGQVKILAPKTLNLTVDANIHLGQLNVDDKQPADGGVGLSRIVDPPKGATGAPITVDVHLADGNVRVERH
ncbi:MAG: PspC domain-containing protein [Jatrophihabitans sp.]|uniref:PspC domain-containing protein n=1 Tax=Jatrophihabitans sp. TaxID=1932789 RepID=UPI00391479A4